MTNIEITNVSDRRPMVPFGRVGRAAELLGAGSERREFRAQLIELDPGVGFEPHQHISAHIILVLQGRGTLTVWSEDDSPRTTLALRAGDLFCIPPNARHAMAAAGDCGIRELIINVPGLALHDVERILWNAGGAMEHPEAHQHDHGHSHEPDADEGPSWQRSP